MKLKIITMSLIGACKAPGESQKAAIMNLRESEIRQSTGFVNWAKKRYGALKAGCVALKNFSKECIKELRCAFLVLRNYETGYRLYDEYQNALSLLERVDCIRNLLQNELKCDLLFVSNKNLVDSIKGYVFSKSPTDLGCLRVRLQSLKYIDQVWRRDDQVFRQQDHQALMQKQDCQKFRRNDKVLRREGDQLLVLCEEFMSEELERLTAALREQVIQPKTAEGRFNTLMIERYRAQEE